MNKLKLYCILGLSLMLSTIITCCNKESNTLSISTDDSVISSEAPSESTTPVETTTATIEPTTINLISVGDMLMHASASSPALQSDGSYNYDYIFANTIESISSADIAIANNEVIMAGNELGNIGYPTFNVRTEFGDSEYNAGFDVVLCATNHSLDQHASGLLNCINYWETNHPDMTYLGIHSSNSEASNITIKNIDGINIALLNYTYGLNGFQAPDDMDYIVDLMNDSTKEKIISDIASAKELADFVIVFPHWGTEYNMGISEEQSEWASFFAEQDVDLIIGTHPHVVEPVQTIVSSTGHSTLIYYSLGNFISIQYYNFSMLGGMAQVSITKDSSGTYISDYGMKFLVTHFTSNRSSVTTYFLDDYTDELASTHAILTEPDEKYMLVNESYPFTVAGLKSLAKQICPNLTNY